MRIKAKLSMTDDIANYITVMAGSMDWICRWLKWHRWFHPWSNLKQLWCNPFCIKEKKKTKKITNKKTKKQTKKQLDMAHGSPSCWLWMLSLFKVWRLYVVFLFFLSQVIWGILVLVYVIPFFFNFDHGLYWPCSPSQLFTKKNIYILKKKSMENTFKIVLCNKGNMQIFF